MRTKGKKLKWYVLNYGTTTGISADKCVYRQNIFFSDFPEQLRKDIKREHIGNREQLKDYLKKEFMYHYWSKSEAEILIGDLHSGIGLEKNKKIIELINAGPFETDKEKDDILRKLRNLYLEEFEKIDIWYQIEQNLDRITDYVISELDIKFKNRKLVEDNEE